MTERFYCRVSVARELTDDYAHEYAARNMHRTLQGKLSEGWAVVDGPEVVEEEDHLRNVITFTAVWTIAPMSVWNPLTPLYDFA